MMETKKREIRRVKVRRVTAFVKENYKTKKGLLVIVLVFATVGTILTLASHAAGQFVSFSAAFGTVSSPANVINDSTTKSGKAVQFSAAAVSSGWPDTTNTGIRGADCNALPTYTGPDPVTTAGTIISGVKIIGNLDVQANNVTLKNSCILANGQWMLKLFEPYGNLTVQDTELRRQHSPTADGTCQPPQTADNCTANYAVWDASESGSMTMTRVNIHDVTSGVHIDANNFTIQDSYIWDLHNISNLDHNDDLICNGNCHNLVFRHNNLEVQLTQTTPLALYVDGYRCGQTTCPNDNVTVDNNLFNGGGYCIYPGTPGSTNFRITNNHFGRKFFPNCGQGGPIRDWEYNTGNTWTGNVWDDTGQAITP